MALRLLSLFLSLATLLGVGEILARIDGDYRAHLTAKMRRHGAREPLRWVDVAEPRPSGRRTETLILAVGDSFTHGLTVGLESSWPKRLEGRLNQESTAARSYTVLNAGVGAASLQREIATIDRAVPTLGPDLIVHQLYLNDFFGSLGFRYEECGRRGRTMKAFEAPQFTLHSMYYLWRWKTRAIHGRRFAQYVNCYAQQERPHWQVAATLLRALQGRLDEAGVRYLAFLAPAMYWRHGEYPFEKMHDSIGSVVSSNVHHYVDLLPSLMAEIDRAQDHWLDPDLPDAHPDAEVHDLFAEQVLEALRRRSLLVGEPAGKGLEAEPPPTRSPE